MYTDISEEWKKQCQHIKEICRPFDLKSFGVDKLEKDIPMEFKVVQYMTQTEQHLKKLYTNPNHFSFNRNSNIMTFDQNRVLLGDQSQKESPDYYINANYVEIVGHQLIATQGPLHSTLNNFWKMIDKCKVSSIVMLCERVENQKVKCDLYWPYKNCQPLDVGDYIVKIISKEKKGNYLKIRKFILTNKLDNQDRQVFHYQFTGWPDGDRPLKTAQKSINKLIDKMVKLIENNEMIVVHCSAGVGRTGTFIAMTEIKMTIPKVQAISVFEIVRRLREQRWAMVYTAIQYEYLYQYTQKQSLKFFQAPNKELQQSSDQEQNQLIC